MYLLDTSVVSNFLDERRYYPQLTARILNQPPEQIFISIITVEEILQGALASIQKAKRKPSVIQAYHTLKTCLRHFIAFKFCLTLQKQKIFISPFLPKAKE